MRSLKAKYKMPIDFYTRGTDCDRQLAYGTSMQIIEAEVVPLIPSKKEKLSL